MPPAYTVAVYDDAPRALLLAFKERGVVGLQHLLGAALATSTHACLEAMGPGDVWLVSVPSRHSTRIERGDDVVARIGRIAARRLRDQGMRVRLLPALRHRRRVLDSAGLTATQRRDNLAGAFRVRSGVLPLVHAGRVVLVDDLMTTGATVTEIAATFAAVGVEVSGAATVAATARRGTNGRYGSAQRR